MAQAARQSLTVAPRYTKPQAFGGTEITWRVLCDLYPAAETPEVVMAVVEYCAARKLDPLRKPVHVVPMWNSKLRRRVQTVMQGINEIETTAHRTKLWAGMDLPVWGPTHTRTFRGKVENDDGSTADARLEMEFPLWCAVTVYRLVGSERRAFTEQLFWEESYATSAFRSEVPNTRWQKAPRQMLHKCTKAAVLRAAFPEEGFGYAAEEMEDQYTDTGGVTIEGKIDHGEPGLTDRDRQADQAYPPPPPGEATAGLDEPNGTLWLRNLTGFLAAAESRQAVVDLRGDPRVSRVLEATETPSLIKGQIEDLFGKAFERFPDEPEAETRPGDPPSDWQDPISELLVEVEAMDLIRINALGTDAQWRAKARAAAAFPPDEDRLNEAIEARKAALQQGRRQ